MSRDEATYYTVRVSLPQNFFFHVNFAFSSVTIIGSLRLEEFVTNP